MEMRTGPEECNWHEEDFEYSNYITDCNNVFQITEGTPKENGFKFCCYCGRKLESHPYDDDND